MKIALKYETDTYWLAGEPGVSERVHSSAADLEFSGQSNVQAQGRVRALNMAFRDRGNLSAGVAWSTVRKFASLSAAEEFALVYDTVFPRTGYLDFYGADGTVKARLDNAQVNPPVRKVTGVSVRMDYSAQGGRWLVPDGGGGFETPEITMGGEVVTMGGEVVTMGS